MSLPLFNQQWGVFLGGAPIIVFDTFVSIDYRHTWNICDYPVERGGFESYNKVWLPFETRVRFASGGSEANRVALLASVKAISGTLQLYDVVTPEEIYTSVNVKHYDFHRTSTNGVGLITIDLWFEEIRETISESSTFSAGSNTNGGAETAPSGGGFVGGGGDTHGGGATGSWEPTDPSGSNPVDGGSIQPDGQYTGPQPPNIE